MFTPESDPSSSPKNLTAFHFTLPLRHPLKTARSRLFTRICLETKEGPYHIIYSLFWGSNGMDIAVVSIAGTTNELWQTYAPTFDKMNAFELIDMRRFEK